jgi:biopolymer transport protein ExbD
VNLSKHEGSGAVTMDMTPMIDMVFQLIIFFMLITDLSQRELEELQLPTAHAAVEDKPDPKVARPIVNVPQNGRIIVSRDVKYDPEKDGDDTRRLEGWLADMAGQMPKKYDETTKSELPDNPLMIRADENTPFNAIQRIMELCGKKGIQIWKVELAAAMETAEQAAAREKAAKAKE